MVRFLFFMLVCSCDSYACIYIKNFYKFISLRGSDVHVSFVTSTIFHPGSLRMMVFFRKEENNVVSRLQEAHWPPTKHFGKRQTFLYNMYISGRPKHEVSLAYTDWLKHKRQILLLSARIHVSEEHVRFFITGVIFMPWPQAEQLIHLFKA